MQHSEVLGESFYVSSVMHEGIFQVFAVGTGSVGNHQNTTAAPRLRCNQSTPFLKRKEHQKVALAHNFRKVAAITEHMHAGMTSIGASLSAYPGMNLPATRNVPSRCAGDFSHAPKQSAAPF